MASFRNVALIAATGNLGSKILRSLTGTGFNVTAVQRKGSSKTLPEGIKSVQVDLTNKADLIAAFRDQDVVVRYQTSVRSSSLGHQLTSDSAVPTPDFDSQKIMLDACVEAGVKRVVPSEYGSNMEAKVRQTRLPNVVEKIEIREYLEGLANAGKIEWSSVNNGPFLDLGIKFGFLGPHIQSKTATFHDGGEKVCCVTSTDDIAEAVALSLKHPEETRNKPVYVYSALVSETKVTDIVSKLTGIDFKIQHVDIQKGVDEVLEMKQRGEEVPWIKNLNLYFLMTYGEGYGGNFVNIAMNKTLGLRVMDDGELEKKIGDYLEEAGVQVRR